MPAGNGRNAINGHCIINGELSPWRPLHPHYDDRIIIVSSTGINDNHHHGVNNSHTHSHFPSVDICAPGYDVRGARAITHNGTPLAFPYMNSSGTSFATPIVAGVCAVLKGINKDLTPVEIKNIIKATADPIIDADEYPGLLGAGRVNAYKAVLKALEVCGTDFTNQVVTKSHTITASCNLNVENVTVTNGAILTLIATDDINVQNVHVNNNSRLVLDAGGKVSLGNGIRVEDCSSLRME